MTRINIEIPKKIHTNAKILAASKEIKLKVYIANAIEYYNQRFCTPKTKTHIGK